MVRQSLAVPTAIFRTSLRSAIPRAAMLHVAGVQFDLRHEVQADEFGETACRQLRHLVAEHQMRVAAATFPTSGTLAQADRLDARVTAIRQALEVARRIGARELTVRLGAIPDDATSREYERLCDVVIDLARHADRVGTRLALGTLGNPVSALRSFMAPLSAAATGLDFDPAGFVFAGECPVNALRELHDVVVHLQVRDGERTASGAGVETAVGQGGVDWDSLLATTTEMTYQGWMTVRRTGGDTPLDDTVRALSLIGDRLR